MRVYAVLVVLVSALVLMSCSEANPTPDLDATIQSAVATQVARISETSTPTPGATKLPSTATPSPLASPTPQPTATLLPVATATPSLVDLVDRARPSVARIDTESGMGSGVIIETNEADGSALVITAFHVVDRASFILVTVFDSQTFDGTLLGVDMPRDIALVRICCDPGFPSLELGDASVVKTGSEVIAVGYPSGFLLEGRATGTTGIVSAVRYNTEFNRWEIQTDAPINPGNSGGPLLSRSGSIIGIVSYIFVGTEGLAFAVGEQTVSGILPILKAGTYLPTPKKHFSGVSVGRTEDFIITSSRWTVDWDTNVTYCGGYVGHIRLFKFDPVESLPNLFQASFMTGGRVLVGGPGTVLIQVGFCRDAQWSITVYDEVYVN